MKRVECTRWNEPVTIRRLKKEDQELLRIQKYRLVLSAAQLLGDDPE